MASAAGYKGVSSFAGLAADLIYALRSRRHLKWPGSNTRWFRPRHAQNGEELLSLPLLELVFNVKSLT